MSEKYDLIFSLGSGPLTASILKKLDLQFHDFPFDFIYGSDFLVKMSMFINKCRGFVTKANIVEIGEHPVLKIKQFQDIKTKFIYPFDFNPDLPIENTYPGVKAKYDKYIKYLYLFIKHSKRILIVYIEDPIKPEENNDSLIIEALGKLKKIYPKTNIDIMYIKNDDTDNDNMKVIKINNNAYKFVFKFFGEFVKGTPKIFEENLLMSVFADIEIKKDWNTKKIIWLQKIIKFLDKIIYKQ